MKKPYEMHCNIAQSLNIIGDKWTLLILHSIGSGLNSYNDILASLPSIPTNLLSNRLKELCKEDMIVARKYSLHPPRYQYELTSKSKDLDDIFHAIMLWGDQHLPTSYKCVRHHGAPVHIAYIDDITGEVLTKDDLEVMKVTNHE